MFKELWMLPGVFKLGGKKEISLCGSHVVVDSPVCPSFGHCMLAKQDGGQNVKTERWNMPE
jgi:hypothetical protein